MGSLKPVRRTLLRESAYRALRDAIVREELAPGTTVTDLELAERLGLSRAPVRESLARLAYEGLVESKPQSYTRITPIAAREVRDAASVVRSMQELAVSAAMANLNDRDIESMRGANNAFRAASRSGDLDAAMAADDDLHGVLIQASRNAALMETVERYTPLIRRLERRLFSTKGAARSAALHDRLIDACAERDSEGARSVFAEIWRVLEDLADESPAK
ncbi:MAG: GntR family transcriptional regulator [Acidimicrobiales bacterium]